jgi:tight adherence protein B
MQELASLCVALALLAAGVLVLRGSRTLAQWLQAGHHRVAERDLADLFIFIDPQHLALYCAAAALLLLMLLWMAGMPLLMALLPVLAVLLCPRWCIHWLRNRRTQRLLAQLPDALALLAGLLRSGHGLTQGLSQLALRQAAPLGQELQLLLRKHRLGLSLDQALAEFHQRVPEADIALLATAVRVSRELGGNLAESLQRLSDGVRSRLVLRGKIHALTSQGRLQGLIVGLMPLGLMAVLSVMDPQPMRLLFSTAAGWCALLMIAVLETLGWYLIRRIVRIEV